MSGDKKTPWNPSRKAIKRVKNPLPSPETCPYCNGRVAIVRNDQIYGRLYGEWPWAYACANTRFCDAYVGMHPFTNIPLGTLADKATRQARKEAKAAFNPLWEKGGMTRTAAYHWLAHRLSIGNTDACHIGWFDIPTCMRVVKICEGARL